jgi:uncharacterized protein YceH (UPF0502 family)
VDATEVELRVLGCLIEKQRTTPDSYPLSLNGLRLACNQSTNRDPVVEYDEETIRIAMAGLSRRGWARLASGPGSRVAKYRHLLDEALGLSQAELALLAVLMLRGPQTPGELKQRAERLHPFASLQEVDDALGRLVERELVARLARRPGQKETRYQQLLGGGTPMDTEAVREPTPERVAGDPISELEARLARVEEQLASLVEALAPSAAADSLAVHADEVAAVRAHRVETGPAPDDVEAAVDGDEQVVAGSSEDPV